MNKFPGTGPTFRQNTNNQRQAIPGRYHPNPTKGKFRVESLEFGVETIEIFDLFGRLVLRTNKPEIDMSSYPAGIYIWQVGTQRGKLVKE